MSEILQMRKLVHEVIENEYTSLRKSGDYAERELWILQHMLPKIDKDLPLNFEWPEFNLEDLIYFKTKDTFMYRFSLVGCIMCEINNNRKVVFTKRGLEDLYRINVRFSHAIDLFAEIGHKTKSIFDCHVDFYEDFINRSLQLSKEMKEECS